MSKLSQSSLQSIHATDLATATGGRKATPVPARRPLESFQAPRPAMVTRKAYEPQECWESRLRAAGGDPNAGRTKDPFSGQLLGK